MPISRLFLTQSAVVILNLTAVIATPGFGQSALDGFDPSADANGGISVFAVQADGKIVIAGSFAQVGGVVRSNLARLNSNGRADTTFIPGPTFSDHCSFCGDIIAAMALQADGKIIVGGYFTTLSGQPRKSLGRLNADGTLDDSFNPIFDTASFSPPRVFSLALQTDGKILVGGSFTTVGGDSLTNLCRLNTDGSLDTAFDPKSSGPYYSAVEIVSLGRDGKFLVRSYNTAFEGGALSSSVRLAWLNANGSFVSEFNPEGYGDIYSLVVQPDGKILVGGGFWTLGGEARTNIGRLNPDNTLDVAFKSEAVEFGFERRGSVECLALQTDGKILVGGSFTTLGGGAHTNFGRLNPDGSADPTFKTSVNDSVGKIFVQPDGKILVWGWFTKLGGQPRNGFGRLNADGSLDVPSTSIAFAGFSKLSNEAFRFSLNHTNGPDFTVLATTNVASPLAGWEVLHAPIYIGGGLYEFSDPDATNHPNRFYRLRWP